MLSGTVKWLEHSYSVLNRVLFGDILPVVVITVMTDKGAFAHITTWKVWKSGDEYYYEVNLSAEHLDRDKINILCSLCHETCHLYNMENDIKDCSNRNRYHNTNFKKTAEEKGLLKIEYGGSIGWSVTRPTEAFINVIRANELDNMDVKCYRTGGVGDSGSGGDRNTGGDGDDNGRKIKPKSSTRKYCCPVCNNKVRATMDMTDKIGCLVCGVAYVERE